MKKLLLLTLVLNLFSFLEAQAQSQAPSRKQPKLSPQSRRTGFATRNPLNNAALGHSVRSFQSVAAQTLSSGVREAWVARYDGPASSNDQATAMAVDAAGNVYVTGSSGTVKYNSAGIQQWVTNWPGNDVAVDGAGNAYVMGYGFNGTKYEYAIIKYNSAGTQQWMEIFQGYPFDLAVDLGDGESNVYVTGYDNSGANSGAAYATVKYNSAGQQQWVSRFYGPIDDEKTALAVDGVGNVYVAGAIGVYPDLDYLTIKYNSTGQQQWVARYNGSGNGEDYAVALGIDPASGDVYVTGHSWNGTSEDYATIKYNAAGTQEWVATYNGAANRYDRAAALAVDGAGNVYVAGSSFDSNTGNDYVTIKYTQSPIANAGPDKMICAAGSVPIGGSPTGSGGHGGPYTFSWSPTTGLDDPTTSNPIASPTTTTTYTVTVTEPATTLSATDTVTVTVPTTGWSVAHIVDVDDVIFGIDQGATLKAAPRDNRGLAISHDERFLYLGYSMSFNQRVVRKIDLSVSDPANNHSAVVAQLKLPPGSQPARDIATDDRGRVYLALGTKIKVYNSNLQTPPLHIISGFTACEGLAVRRENGAPAVYATERLDKTLKRFVLVEGAGETIASSSKAGLDGDGEVLIVGGSRPRGLDIASDGTAWIADLGKSRVYRVNSAGTTMDSTGVRSPMDVAIDASRGEVYVSQYTLRTIKVLNLSTGKIKRTLTPPAADLNLDLDGETGSGALCGIDVASCKRVYVANEMGRSLLTPSEDSPFSNVGDNNDVKAADTDPVLLVTGNVLSKESEVEESEVASDQLAVTSYQLEQNYPNPFNPSTKISLALPEEAEVSLKIYDIAGQLVQTLIDDVVEAGRHQMVWDGTNQYGLQVASGVYFYQLRAGEFKQVRKMSLVR